MRAHFVHRQEALGKRQEGHFAECVIRQSAIVMGTSSSFAACRVPSAIKKRSLTLIEMIIVISILAIVSTSLISVVGDTDDQLRYDETVSRLEAVKKALIGETDLVNGQIVVSGFIADMGRLPKEAAVTGTFDLTELIELGSQSKWTFDSNSGLSQGWRGPYVNFSSGESRINDAWGNEIVATMDSVSQDVTLTSFGSDGVIGGEAGSYEEDIELKISKESFLTKTIFTMNVTNSDVAPSPDRIVTISLVNPYSSTPISANVNSEAGTTAPLSFEFAEAFGREFVVELPNGAKYKLKKLPRQNNLDLPDLVIP